MMPYIYCDVILTLILFTQKSVQTARYLHLEHESCVQPSELSSAVFTSVVSRAQCVVKCASSPGCVAVAVDGQTQSMRCSLLTVGDFPLTTVQCGDPATAITIYKDPDVNIPTTTTATTTTTTPTTTPLSIYSTCHCVYDMDNQISSYVGASQQCNDIGGTLPEADNSDRIQVCCNVGH